MYYVVGKVIARVAARRSWFDVVRSSARPRLCRGVVARSNGGPSPSCSIPRPPLARGLSRAWRWFCRSRFGPPTHCARCLGPLRGGGAWPRRAWAASDSPMGRQVRRRGNWGFARLHHAAVPNRIVRSRASPHDCCVVRLDVCLGGRLRELTRRVATSLPVTFRFAALRVKCILSFVSSTRFVKSTCFVKPRLVVWFWASTRFVNTVRQVDSFRQHDSSIRFVNSFRQHKTSTPVAESLGAGHSGAPPWRCPRLREVALRGVAKGFSRSPDCLDFGVSQNAT